VASGPTALLARATRSKYPPDRFEILAARRHGHLIDLDVEVDCWSGTYIRALARDLGDALGVGAHLTALRRTRVGPFAIDRARTLDALADRPQLSYTLDAACLQMFPRRNLTAEEADAAANGRALVPAGIDGVYAAQDANGRVIALLRDDGPRTKSVVVIRPATL
jgi:tRNA pseudouridine55 synthase